jgi:hypothetical protein
VRIDVEYLSRGASTVKVLFAAVFLLVPFGHSAFGQTRTDSVDVMRSVTAYYANAINNGRGGPFNKRLGLERRTFSYAISPNNRQGATPTWTAARPPALQSSILAGISVTSAAPLEDQPRQCVDTEFRGKAVETCGLRDYDVIIAFSTPIFQGNQATIMLLRRDNTKNPLSPIATGILRYSLRNVNGAWTVISVEPVLLS